jgi:hypothetical protein
LHLVVVVEEEHLTQVQGVGEEYHQVMVVVEEFPPRVRGVGVEVLVEQHQVVKVEVEGHKAQVKMVALLRDHLKRFQLSHLWKVHEN